MTITAATAALVFVIGRALLPQPQGTGTAPVATRVEQPPQSPPPVVAPVDAMPDGAGDDGSAAVQPGLDAIGAGPAAVVERGRDASPLEPTHAGDDAMARQSADARQADKDLARSAWRANWPDVRVSGPRASIIVPLKGSAAGGTYKFFPKTRVVAIVLPHAAALTTMHYYKVAQGGFRALWTFQDENNALAENGTKLRLKLDVAALPQVELTDDFVKVTIRSPREDE